MFDLAVHCTVTSECICVRYTGGDSGNKLHVTPSNRVSNSFQELTLQLTDPADPFFFYSLTLTESDFGALRRQQGLILDFAQFPAMITKLADKASGSS